MCNIRYSLIILISFVCPITYASPIYNLEQYSYSFRGSIGLSYNDAIESFANNEWSVATAQQVEALLLDVTGYTTYSAWSNNFDWNRALHETIGVTFEGNHSSRATFYFGEPYYGGVRWGTRINIASIADLEDAQAGRYREISHVYWDSRQPWNPDPVVATMFVRENAGIPEAPTIALLFIGGLALWLNWSGRSLVLRANSNRSKKRPRLTQIVADFVEGQRGKSESITVR